MVKSVRGPDMHYRCAIPTLQEDKVKKGGSIYVIISNGRWVSLAVCSAGFINLSTHTDGLPFGFEDKC